MKQFGRVLRPNRAGAFVGLVVVIFVAVLAACSSSKDDAPTFGTLGAGIDQPDSVKLQLYLDGNNLTLLGAREAQDDPRGPITSALEPVIYWEFVDDSGKTVAMGAIRDPRVMHGETPDAMGNLSRYETTVPQALLDIDIPNVGGELRLYDNPTYAMSASGTSTMSLHPLGIFSSNPFASIKVPQWLRDLWNRFFGKKDPPPPPPKTDDQIGLSHPVNHGNCGREFNILVVGEGYTQAQLGKFQSDAQQVANDLAAQAGYSDNWTQVNVHTLAIASQDTGIYDPQMPGVQKNTAFNIGYGDPANGGVRRCALPRGGGPPASTQAQVAEAQRRTNANVTAVIINVDGSTANGQAGCASGGMIYEAVSPAGDTTFGHELGHALFGLGDEYAEAGRCNKAGADGYPNTSVQCNPPKWNAIVNTEFPSGNYCDGVTAGEEVCHPEANCLMRTLGVPFCKVCANVANQKFKAQADKAAANPSPKPECQKDAGPDAAAQPDGGGAADAGGPADAGGKGKDIPLYDSCKGKSDGVYCSQLIDFSAIVCKGESIVSGQQCANSAKCLGPNGAGTMVQCQGATGGGGGPGGGGGGDAGLPPKGDCGGRADGTYCNPNATYSAIVCKNGSIAGGQFCSDTKQTCTGPNGPGNITCQ